MKTDEAIETVALITRTLGKISEHLHYLSARVLDLAEGAETKVPSIAAERGPLDEDAKRAGEDLRKADEARAEKQEPDIDEVSEPESEAEESPPESAPVDVPDRLDVRAVLVQIQRNDSSKAVTELLKPFGAKNLGQVKEEDLAALYQNAKEALKALRGE